jgi:hypothetical protein
MPDLPLSKFLKVVERNCLVEALETCKTAKDAAVELGLSYVALRKKANRHGIHLTAFHKQRGFIFGGSLGIYLAMAIAAAALAIGMYAFGRSEGRKLERAEWTEQQNSDLRTANQAIDAAHKKAREQEARSAQKVAAVSTAYQKDLANANRAKDLAMAALRSGALVLRDPGAASGQADAGGTCQAATGPTRSDGGTPGQLPAASAGFLSQRASEFLIGLAGEADQLAGQLAGCQAVVRADRGG